MKRIGEVLTGARPLGGVSVLAAVVVFAVAVFAIVLHTLQSDTELSDRQAIGLALAQGLALVLVLRAPHAGWALALGVAALSALWVGDGLWVDATLNSYLIVLGSAALRVSPRAAAGHWLATVAVCAVLASVLRPADWLSASITVALLAGVVQLAGSSLGGLIAAQHSLREQRAATRRERERSALLAERARIARELHDVVAHHMSVIAIQAEAARHRDPETMPDTLAAIRSSAVTAMGEMRRILEVLRSGDTGVSPQPGLGDLGTLVEAVRATGTRIELDLPAPAPELPRGVGLTVYRLVQEALSNAVRHAPGAPVRIRIMRNGTDIGVTIENPHDTASVEPGHGLTGMRERATALGGTFDAGPAGDGTFRVTATLPVEVLR
ncbi:sensor histidine kinase [Nocardia sp. XZ_19_385]|uniref:sensor histidine kinase n=1 Tax=Nocardia sp. XZ_19_385 TaxID=2769488 RepID=UPI00188E291D|nr:histidine kinase [Nocardia sp. XZ_19_385]